MSSLLAPTGDIIWLASYPRSGNTWVRFLLTVYFTGSARQSNEVAHFVPDLHVVGHHGISHSKSDFTFIKTHFMHGPGHPLLDRTRGAILLLRHPRDVLLSSLGLHRAIGSRDRQSPFTDLSYAQAFINFGGDPQWARHDFGTWEEHAISWLEAAFPIHCLRYEEMRKEPERCLAGIIEFIGEKADHAKVSAAVSACTFESMQKIEQMEKAARVRDSVFSGSAEKWNAGFRFVAQGRRNSTLDDIAAGLNTAFDARFGDAIRRFGYRVD